MSWPAILAELEPEAVDNSARSRRHVGDDQIRAYITVRRRHREDWILCPARSNALLDVEAKVVNAAVIAEAGVAIATGNAAVLGACMQLFLIATGALSTQGVRLLRVAPLAVALADDTATVVTPDGYLVRNVPMPPQRYRPPTGITGLEPVIERLALRLPVEVQPALVAWVESLHPNLDDGILLLFPPGSIPNATLSRLDDRIRARTHVRRFTAARLANTLPLTVMAQRHDLAVVQTVTGDTQGLSTTACAYFSPTMATLQDAFDHAVEAMGFTRSPLSADSSYGVSAPSYA